MQRNRNVVEQEQRATIIKQSNELGSKTRQKRRPVKPNQEASQGNSQQSEILESIQNTFSKISKEEKLLDSNIDFPRRLRLAKLYDFVIQTNVKVAVKYDLFKRKWHVLVYGLIQKHRTEFSTMDSAEKSAWHKYLDDVLDIYTIFFQKHRDVLKGNLVSRMLGQMGDISRYQAVYFAGQNPVNEWSEAESYYLGAYISDPSSAHCLSQLGLCSAVARNYLAATSLYFRALHSKKPFGGARESILEVLSKVSLWNVGSPVQRIEKLFLEMINSLYTKIK
jgi:hypothetical protein